MFSIDIKLMNFLLAVLTVLRTAFIHMYSWPPITSSQVLLKYMIVSHKTFSQLKGKKINELNDNYSNKINKLT